MLKYNRILLKLSGESLGGAKGYGFDGPSLKFFALEIQKARQMGAEIAVVLGGGNIYRGARTEGLETDRVTGDYMGMLSTIINSMALQDELIRLGVDSLLMSGLKIDRICDFATRSKMLRALSDGKVILLAGGTGNPFFTTDSAAALRAAEINADALLKGTRVDGIYSDDPEKNPRAEKYNRITFDHAIRDRLRIMDQTAFTICHENLIPIVVFNISEENVLSEILKGSDKGSIVCP